MFTLEAAAGLELLLAVVETNETASFIVSPFEPDTGLADNNDDVKGGVEPDVTLMWVTFAVAFEWIEEGAALRMPVVVDVGCTTDEFAIRSESLSDKSELLEELSLMSQ